MDDSAGEGDGDLGWRAACGPLTEPVPPVAYRLMSNVDLALVEQVFDVRNDSGYLTYISTARRITLGEELK